MSDPLLDLHPLLLPHLPLASVRRGEIHLGGGEFKRLTPAGTAYGHAGWFPGYRAAMLHFADWRLSVAVMTNADATTGLSDWAVELARAWRTA